LAELRNRITQKINEINNNPIVLENVTNAIRRRTRLCLQEQQGRRLRGCSGARAPMRNKQWVPSTPENRHQETDQ
jgi:hypothetical protein